MRITVTKNKLYWCHGYLLVQNSDCRPDIKCRLGTKCRLQTVEWVQNAAWESKEFFRLVCDNMLSYNLQSVTQSLIRNQLSRFLAGFFIRIDLNIISSLHIVFSLCVRAGWCDVCTDFTNVIKVDVNVNEMSLLNIQHAQYSTALHVVCIIIFLSGMCLFCGKKWGPWPKPFLRLDIFSTLVNHIILTYLRKSFIPTC